MIRRFFRYCWLILSGIYVLLFSLWMSGPGIAEDETAPIRWYFMLPFFIWVIGFILQVRATTRMVGIAFTILLTVLYLIFFLIAFSM